MRTSFLFRTASLALMAAVLFAAPLSAAPIVDGDDPIAQVTAADGTISWTPVRSFDRMLLIVNTPDGKEITREYLAGEVPSMSALGTDLGLLPDGDFIYRLVMLDAPADGVMDGEYNSVATVQEGHFAVNGFDISQPQGMMAQVFTQDVVVQGSLCVGVDCPSNPSFGFDTIRLAENNLRIKFEDTSNSGSFPTNDWEITINDSSNGGANYFGITDVSAGNRPVTVSAGSGANALYISSNGGNVGLGTASPVVELHVTDGDSPTMRLEQNGSNGWTPQTWDVAGNETNFFVRDVTNGSRLPFKIKPGAPDNSLFIAANGGIALGSNDNRFGVRLDVRGSAYFDDNNAATTEKVGINTTTPSTALHVVGSATVSADANIAGGLNLTGALIGQNVIGLLGNYTGLPWAFRVKNSGTNTTLFKLEPSGNATLAGTLTQGSSATIKNNFQAVDSQVILDRLAAMPIWTWQYNEDPDGTRHLGPTSQDFMAAFGVGADDEHIATVDADGVTMAAIQALYTQLQQRDVQVATLTEQNEALEARLARLEALLLQDGDASND